MECIYIDASLRTARMCCGCLPRSPGIGAAESASYHSCLVEYPRIRWQAGHGVASGVPERSAGGLLSGNEHQNEIFAGVLVVPAEGSPAPEAAFSVRPQFGLRPVVPTAWRLVDDQCPGIETEAGDYACDFFLAVYLAAV